MTDPISDERLAEIRERCENGADSLELLLDCLGNGINVLDHTSKGRDNWINDLKRYQADHVGLLAEVDRLREMAANKDQANSEIYAANIDLRAVLAEHQQMQQRLDAITSDMAKLKKGDELTEEWGVRIQPRGSAHTYLLDESYDTEDEARAVAKGYSGGTVMRRLVGEWRQADKEQTTRTDDGARP